MKRSATLLVTLLLTTSSLLAPFTGLAQQQGRSPVSVLNDPATISIGGLLLERLRQPTQRKPNAAKPAATRAPARTSVAGGKRGASPAPEQSYDDPVFHFRPTGTVLTTDLIVAQVTTDQVQGGQLATVLRAILDAYEKEARRLGRPNDLPMALSFFVLGNLYVYQGTLTNDIPDDTLLSTRDLFATTLAGNAAVAGMDDRRKQMMYELLVQLAGLAVATYQNGVTTGDTGSVQSARQLAASNLQALLGVSADNVNLPR